MCGYLRGADCSRKLVVTVRVLVCLWGPVIDLQTTRGPVTITPVPPLDEDTLKTCWTRTKRQMHLYTGACTHADTRDHIQTHSCLSELHAGQRPTVIKTRLLWRHRHHANTHSHGHMCAHTAASRQIVYFQRIVCLLTWYTETYLRSQHAAFSIRGKKTVQLAEEIDGDTDRHKHRQTHSHGSRHEVSNAI